MSQDETIGKLEAIVAKCFPPEHRVRISHEGSKYINQLVEADIVAAVDRPRLLFDGNSLGDAIKVVETSGDDREAIYVGELEGIKCRIHLIAAKVWEPGDEAYLVVVNTDFEMPREGDSILVPAADLPPILRVRIRDIRDKGKAEVEIIGEKGTGAIGLIDLDDLR